MSEQSNSTTKHHRVIRRILIAVLIVSATIPVFPFDALRSKLVKFLDADSGRAVSFLSSLWLFSAPIGAVAGIIFGNSVLRSARLTIDTLNLLRIIQWAPFLIVWTLAFGLTAKPGQQLSLLWLLTYCAVSTGLATAYDYLMVRYFGGVDWKTALKKIVRTAIMRGLFISLLLDVTVAGELWSPGSGEGVGYTVCIFLAAIVLLINWFSGETFYFNAVNRWRLLLAVFESENLTSLIGPSLLILLCMALWLVTAPFLFTASPVTVLTSLSMLLAGGEFYGDVSVSLSELAAGMLVSGLLAAAIVFLRNRFLIVSRLSDPLIQVCQLAPIAALPQLQYVYRVGFSRSSILCVAVFTLYPFLCAFTGLRGQGVVRRVALATSEALPYGCAAFVFGEMWNATAGIGFMMTVAAATHQIDKGMAGFVVLMLLFATLTIILHWIARNVSLKPALVKSALGF